MRFKEDWRVWVLLILLFMGGQSSLGAFSQDKKLHQPHNSRALDCKDHG